MTADDDPYAVLHIGHRATPAQVAAAYRGLARRHHPDVSHERDAERRMAEINNAWAILRNPVRRAAWDRAHDPSSPLAHGSAAASRGGVAATKPAAGAAWRRGPHGEGAAGPPPGNPRGSVLTFGRHIGWSLGEVARVDPGYLVWLASHREGAPYREEISALVAGMTPRQETSPETRRRRGLFG